jgi:lipopolysaccharide transport system permease protein
VSTASLAIPETDSRPVTRIGRSRSWLPLDVRELWAYRELMYFLVWRDIKVRYRQTVLGAAWAVIQPFLTMVVFSVFLGRLAHVPSDGAPYPVFAYAALVPWTYFATALTQASSSLVDHSRLITKVYFPRVLVPAAAVAGGLVDLAIAFAVLVAMMAYYGIVASAAIAFLPFFVLLTAATALGAGLWSAALNVRYRDVRYVMPFVVQFCLFVTPVAYPSSVVPERWRAVYALNPMVGIIEGFRWTLLGLSPPGAPLVVSVVMAVAVLVSGLCYFTRTERSFADIL